MRLMCGSLTRFTPSLAGAFMLSMTYGYQVKYDGPDHFVWLAERTTEDFAHACLPGAFLVDVIPAREYKTSATHRFLTLISSTPFPRVGSRRRMEEAGNRLQAKLRGIFRYAICIPVQRTGASKASCPMSSKADV